MTTDEVAVYWIPACQNLFVMAETPNYYRDFWGYFLGQLDDLLGVSHFQGWKDKHFHSIPEAPHGPLPEEMKNLLTALAGPHGKAVLKAYRINKGLCDERT